VEEDKISAGSTTTVSKFTGRAEEGNRRGHSKTRPFITGVTDNSEEMESTNRRGITKKDCGMGKDLCGKAGPLIDIASETAIKKTTTGRRRQKLYHIFRQAGIVKTNEPSGTTQSYRSSWLSKRNRRGTRHHEEAIGGNPGENKREEEGQGGPLWGSKLVKERLTLRKTRGCLGIGKQHGATQKGGESEGNGSE